jgi:hypothetical protein
MIASLKLLLPALIPSWRFFDVIGPSPSIEYACLNSEQEQAGEWQEYSIRPQQRSFLQVIGHLFYNADWNQFLYITRCAEKLLEEPSDHSEAEIVRLLRQSVPAPQARAAFIQFRILLTEREAGGLHTELAYVSVPYSWAPPA